MTAQTSPLLAALDAIEETARRATPGPWGTWAGPRHSYVETLADDDFTVLVQTSPCGTDADIAHIARMDPAFTLRLVEGLREVVAALPMVADVDGGHARLTPPGQRVLAALTRALAGEEEGAT